MDVEKLTPENRVPVGGIYFTKRELVFLVFGLVGLVLLCVTIGILGSGIGRENITVSARSGGVNGDVCYEPECLEASASIRLLRDASKDHCKNFYEYACSAVGQFNVSNLDENQLEFKFISAIKDNNEERLRSLLGETPKRTSEWSYEKKIKDFYSTCLDTYGNTRNGSMRFINHILNPSGGWSMIGSMNESYDYTVAMKKVHVDFYYDALFKVKVATDYLDPKKRVIEIGLGGLTLYWWEYTYNSNYYQKLFRATKTFIQTIASLVIRDSGEVKDPSEIERRAAQFAEDVFAFEATIANTTWYSLPAKDPHAQENRKRIYELNDIADLFDWESILTTMFNQAKVNRNTQVVILEDQFLSKLNGVIKNLPNATYTLNNYFTWRLMLGYVTDLGWEYVHANREFYEARTGLTNFLGIPTYCFNKAKSHFSDALGALYIRDHLVDSDKATVDDIVKYLKMGLQDRLEKISWIEEESRDVALKKVKAIVDKVGYPTWMKDNDFLDGRYKDMTIKTDDYLHNLIEIAKFELTKINSELLTGEDKSSWRRNVFDPDYHYDQYWNELLVAAGILKYPIFAGSFPKYYNFGALGVTLGHELVHSIDEYGSLFLPNGTFYDWWTNNTLYNYYNKLSCLQKQEVTAGPYYQTPDSPPVSIKINATYVAYELSAEMAAIRMAYDAYKDWTSSNGVEKLAPGLDMTNEQTFFLAYAQTQCFVRRDSYSIIKAERRIIPEDQRLNLALKNTPEFVAAFNCPVGSDMHAEEMCEVF